MTCRVQTVQYCLDTLLMVVCARTPSQPFACLAQTMQGGGCLLTLLGQCNFTTSVTLLPRQALTLRHTPLVQTTVQGGAEARQRAAPALLATADLRRARAAWAPAALPPRHAQSVALRAPFVGDAGQSPASASLPRRVFSHGSKHCNTLLASVNNCLQCDVPTHVTMELTLQRCECVSAAARAGNYGIDDVNAWLSMLTSAVRLLPAHLHHRRTEPWVTTLQRYPALTTRANCLLLRHCQTVDEADTRLNNQVFAALVQFQLEHSVRWLSIDPHRPGVMRDMHAAAPELDAELY